MADLKFVERQSLEQAFGMASGYVLDFSNRTFQDFVSESTGRNIYEHKYSIDGDSKAKRLRTFIRLEPDRVAGKLIADLVTHAKGLSAETDSELLERCDCVAERLCRSAPTLEELQPITAGPTFHALADSVRKAIADNKPEAGLDRLHTYFVSYLRQVCEKNGVGTARDEPAHSYLGKYVKHLRVAGRIESEMTERILKYALSTVDAFNRVRNEQSLAHPNPILNYHEALLIFNHIVSVVNFVGAIEAAAHSATPQPTASIVNVEDFPF